MSTTRSDEDHPDPGSTLSLDIAQFHLSWPDIHDLAMNPRLIGLSTGSNRTVGLNLVA